MKKLSMIIISLMLALSVACSLPAQVFADSVPEYISEVKIGMGKEPEDAKASLADYKILSDDKGNPVDRNQKAGGSIGSKGEKTVYLGYKTTTERSEAVTDLALMNMKGGYSVKEYEALLQYQMDSQIIPLVDNFLSAINEYRENYNSDNEENKARAVYVHDVLDKFIDDDTGRGLGELLLNETKYEMGDEAYNKLSAEEKKNHADILTIIAQSNGRATLMIENLITRAADTNDDTWIDRLSGLSYDNLLSAFEGLPTDVAAKAAKLYDNDAVKILNMWDDFRNNLLDYDNAVKAVSKYDAANFRNALDKIESLNDASPENEKSEALEDYTEARSEMMDVIAKGNTAAIHDMLAEVEYGDGTLLDFFTRSAEEAESDKESLYPLVASLSDGQRAGLDFISLEELTSIALSSAEGYKDVNLDALQEASIYEGVDRTIYRKGGVALTSDAIRKDAEQLIQQESDTFSDLTIDFMIIATVTFSVLTASAVVWVESAMSLARVNQKIDAEIRVLQNKSEGMNLNWTRDDVFRTNQELADDFEFYTSKTSTCAKLTVGLTVVFVVITFITTYLSYRDLVDYYKVEFTPIPHYMVDEKDITAYNEFGEKVVFTNQAVFYKAVECNRTDKDEMYNNLGTCADMNGDVGKQWLALYAQKSDVSAPILADSLLVKVNDSSVPAGYTTGIHMFGSGSAFNLNSELYDWNKDSPSVMVYFRTDTKTAKTANTSASNFSAGSLALALGAGLALGAVISGFAVSAAGKKKNKKAEA